MALSMIQVAIIEVLYHTISHLRPYFVRIFQYISQALHRPNVPKSPPVMLRRLQKDPI